MPVQDVPTKTPVCYWQPGSQIRVDASAAYTEFEAIKKANLGSCTPAQVVERAKGPTSKLHDVFTWDNTAAANAHRLEEARHLLRSFVVVYTRPSDAPGLPPINRPMPEFVKLREHKDTPAITEYEKQVTQRGVYVSVADIMADSGTRRLLLHQAWRDFAVLRRKYGDLSEFAEIFDAIDRAKGKIA